MEERDSIKYTVREVLRIPTDALFVDTGGIYLLASNNKPTMVSWSLPQDPGSWGPNNEDRMGLDSAPELTEDCPLELGEIANDTE